MNFKFEPSITWKELRLWAGVTVGITFMFYGLYLLTMAIMEWFNSASQARVFDGTVFVIILWAVIARTYYVLAYTVKTKKQAQVVILARKIRLLLENGEFSPEVLAELYTIFGHDLVNKAIAVGGNEK